MDALSSNANKMDFGEFEILLDDYNICTLFQRDAEKVLENDLNNKIGIKRKDEEIKRFFKRSDKFRSNDLNINVLW